MRQLLKIKNSTHWDTRDLRRLFLRCLKERGASGKWQRYILKVSYARSGGDVMGYGRVGGPWVHLLLPSPSVNSGFRECIEEPGHLTVGSTAKIILHEIDHNLSLKHKDMISWSSIEVPWVAKEGFRVRWNEPKKKPKADLQEKRHEHAKDKPDEWVKKQKRTAKIVKKWRQKVRYYERASEKKAALQKGGER